MRRAQLDVQFNWIFILIAGAVILALFFKVANTQRQISEDKAAIRLQNDFDAITTAALQSKDTIQTVQLPSLGLHFDCADCTCMIKFGRFAMPFEDRVIFTPYAVTGPDAKLWTLDWKMPFRITNFLYITNDNVKYYIVSSGSSQLADHIKSALPTEENGVTGINTEFITDQDISTIVYNNENRVVFVLLDGLQAKNLDADFLKQTFPLKKVDVRAVEVYTTPVTQVAFYKRDPKTGDIDLEGGQGYLGDELLFAAIIAQDTEAYTCNLITALQRIQGVGKTAMRRAEMLSTEASAPNSPWSQCAGIYSVVINGDPTSSTSDPNNPVYEVAGAPLATIINAAAAVVDMKPCGGDPYVFRDQNSDKTFCNVYILQDAAASLAQQNDKLLALSCPTVY